MKGLPGSRAPIQKTLCPHIPFPRVWPALCQCLQEAVADRGAQAGGEAPRAELSLQGPLREEGLEGQEGGSYLPESPWQALPLIESPKEEDPGSAAPLPATGSLREWWSLPGGNAGESHVRREPLGGGGGGTSQQPSGAACMESCMVGQDGNKQGEGSEISWDQGTSRVPLGRPSAPAHLFPEQMAFS